MSNSINSGSINIGSSNVTTGIPGNATITTGWDASSINIHSGSGYSSGVSSGTIISSSLSLGNVITSTGTYTIGVSDDMIDFYELILAALGYDITYQDFAKMTKEQRKSLLREVKLKRLID